MRGNELLEAAKAGDEAKVRQLLDDDPSLAGTRADSGETPLMAALYRGHAGLAGQLADAAAALGPLDLFAAAALGRRDALEAALTRGNESVNGFSYDGWTPLHLAAFFGRTEAAERLIACGADLAARSRNSLTNTPLHAAVAGGHADVSLLLIDKGADVHAVDSGGHTALHIAAENGSVPIAQALLARGADAHAVDAEEKTPLSRAAARNRTEIVDLINVRE